MFLKKIALYACAIFTIASCQLKADQQQGYNNQVWNQNSYPSNQGMSKTVAPQGRLQWYTNYNQAVSVARQQQKPMLLFFTGSDWCGWCKKIDSEVFDTSEFSNLVGSKFVFVKLDFPMKTQLPKEEAQQNQMLKQKYGVTGFPTIVVLDPHENFLAETGYRPGGAKEYADYLMSLTKT